jgi:niacin transporter
MMLALANSLKTRTIDLAFGAVMAALALVIPLAFRGTPLQLNLPALGYSATLASHVPEMLSILAGPFVAFGVGVASALGFLVTLSPVVGLRAFTHGIWGALASFGYRRGWSFLKVMIIIALPIHAVGEGLAVMVFGFPVQAQLVTIAGTAIHHLIDLAISMVILRIVQPLLAPVILTGIRLR